MIDKIVEWFPEDEVLIADGFNDAIIGIDSNSMKLKKTYIKEKNE